MKVIVVDDNKIELREVSRLVEQSELELELVGKFVNGQEAYEFVMENEVDIIISDVQMPVMDGIELIHKLKQNRKMAEVIFISCYDDFNYMRGALKNDAFDYILKPIDKNEFKLVLAAICEKCKRKKSMAHAREEAGKKLEKYQKTIEEECLRLQLLGTCGSEEEVVPELPKIQSPFTVTIAKGRIVDVTCVGEDEDFGEKKAWIINLVKRQIDSIEVEGLKVYTIIMSLSEVAIVFIAESTTHDIEGELIWFKQKMANELGIWLSFGMSNQGKGVSDLPELYWQAGEALCYTYGSRKTNVLKFEDVAVKSSEDVDTGLILESVKKLLAKGEREEIGPFLAKHISEELNRQSYVKNFAYAVMYSAEMVLLEYGRSLNRIFGNDMWEKMNSFDTIVNPRQWLYNMLLQAIESIHLRQDEASDNRVRIVDKIKRIIHQRYSEKLTVGMIAEELHYSSKYISEIFLEVEKKSIFEYLTEYRIEVAKNMLKNPESKIYMVVESVGYKRKTHFYDVFKSYVGVTPMEYKQLYSSGKTK